MPRPSHTSTLAYKALKYSRMYPGTSETSSQRSTEWQHYREPSLRVLLDITKAPPANPCYRLRILMNIESHSNSQATPYAAGQGTPDIALVSLIIINPDLGTAFMPDYIQEDLELSAFSNSDKTSDLHSVPLKAVYTNTTVAFRYMAGKDLSGSIVCHYFIFPSILLRVQCRFIDAFRLYFLAPNLPWTLSKPSNTFVLAKPTLPHRLWVQALFLKPGSYLSHQPIQISLDPLLLMSFDL
jgi:hypothetical protein